MNVRNRSGSVPPLSSTFSGWRIFCVALLAITLCNPSVSQAQSLRKFVGFGSVSDLNDDVFPAVNGGLTRDLFKSWISAGFQGELFFSEGYAAGRAGPVVRANLLRKSSITPFLIGGAMLGEDGGPMYGGGVEYWAAPKLGFRVSGQTFTRQFGGFDCKYFGYDQPYCEEHFNGGRAYTKHTISVQFGVTWR